MQLRFPLTASLDFAFAQIRDDKDEDIKQIDTSISSSETSITHKGEYIYLEVLLQGGTPWGFTLKGGLEHGESLAISKVLGFL